LDWKVIAYTLAAAGFTGVFVAVFAHRIATHLKAVSVVDQPVEDAIGHGRVADLLMPAGHR
jgi:hypothetical protein